MQALAELDHLPERIQRAFMKTRRTTDQLTKSKSKPSKQANLFETNGFSLGLFMPMF